MTAFEQISSLPRLNKALLPTPLEYLPNFSVSAGARIYIKRDDLTGHVFGGNKERKLDLIVRDAQIKGSRTLVTVGAPHSNHCRMTAVLGAVCGMNVELIIISESDKLEIQEGNLLLDMMCGAKIHVVKPHQVQDKIDELMQTLDAPYFIAGGGHSVLGLAAYVDAARELKDQCEQQGIVPQHIVVPCGTGTTFAGIVMGCSLLDWKVQVLGYSVARPASRCREAVDEVCRRGEEFLLLPPQSLDYEVNDRFIGSGYGELYPDCVAAMHQIARLDGIIIDPVYNAKTVAGMLSGIKRGDVGGTIVYWNTGGQPAVFIGKYRQSMFSGEMPPEA